MRHAALAKLLVAAFLLASGLSAQPQGESLLTASAVEAIDAFHEVMEPLWHSAYPQDDIGAIAKSVPSLKAAAERVAQVATTDGPEEFRALAESLGQSVSALEASVAGGQSTDILSSLEVVHDDLHALMELGEAKEHTPHTRAPSENNSSI
jgi:hypothetical protein